jgi:hypothetical protein
MSQAGAKSLKQKRRRGGARIVRNILLLPPALLYVIVEEVFWRGAKRLLRQVARLQAVAGLQSGLEKLPAAAILPLFLIPEVISHIGGFWASALLVHRHLLGALLVGLFVKGTATILEVWIYQSCEAKLLSVRWFAWAHRQVMRLKDWVDEATRPARRLITGSRSALGRRFAALKTLVGRRIGIRP